MENYSARKYRIEWIDMARGFGIILSIYGHLGYDLLTSWIYSFHMPLFFFISGFLFNCRGMTFIDFLKRKIKSLIIPYFFLGIPMVFAYILQYRVFSLDGIVDLLFQFILQQRFLTLWFISCLFVLNIVFFFISKNIESDLVILIVCAFSLLIGDINYKIYDIVFPWNIDICFMAIPFFALGYLFKKRNIFSLFLISKNRNAIYVFVFLFLSLTTWYLNLSIYEKCLDMYSKEYGLLPITYLSAIFGLLFIVCLSRIVSIKPILYIGEYSILYFLWHQSIIFPFIGRFLMPISRFIFGNLLSIRLFGISVEKLYVTLLTCLIVTIINNMIMKTKFKFVLGK